MSIENPEEEDEKIKKYLEDQQNNMLNIQTKRIVSKKGEYPEINSLPGRKMMNGAFMVFYDNKWMNWKTYIELAKQARREAAVAAEQARIAKEAAVAAEQARIAKEAARVRDDERKEAESWQRLLTSRKPIRREGNFSFTKKERLYILKNNGNDGVVGVMLKPPNKTGMINVRVVGPNTKAYETFWYKGSTNYDLAGGSKKTRKRKSRKRRKNRRTRRRKKSNKKRKSKIKRK